MPEERSHDALHTLGDGRVISEGTPKSWGELGSAISAEIRKRDDPQARHPFLRRDAASIPGYMDHRRGLLSFTRHTARPFPTTLNQRSIQPGCALPPIDNCII